MTNAHVGDVWAKIIEEVVAASTTDFEEYAVPSSTLQEMQKAWQVKLSARNVAQMPWDPKPAPPPQANPIAPPPSMPAKAASNGATPASYNSFENSQASSVNGTPVIKTEGQSEPQYPAPIANYAAPLVPAPPQGGLVRAQQLVQQQYGAAANPSLNAMQRGGLALPGQTAKPQMPPGQQPGLPQQNFQMQQQAAMRRQQQQYQDQNQPRIKGENDGPTVPPNGFASNINNQTDGAGDADDDLTQWRIMLAARRTISATDIEQNDRMMQDRIASLSRDLQSGLLLPLRSLQRRSTGPSSSSSTAVTRSAAPSIPQLDGDVDDDDEHNAGPAFTAAADEDDENAINSDLDDPNEDGAGGGIGGEDEDDGDTILSTYDKVQRVKNKWKCVLKDGVMSVGGKEYVFHKATGEYEW